MVKVRTHNVRGIHHSSDGANAEKGCSHQHVAKICKSGIRWSKDRMTHTHNGASHQGNEAWVRCMGRWHTVVAKPTTVFIDHPLPNVQTIGHAGVFLFFTFGIFLFFSSVQSTTHMSMHKNEGSVLQEC